MAMIYLTRRALLPTALKPWASRGAFSVISEGGDFCVGSLFNARVGGWRKPRLVNDYR
jgi:hypothetical protein